ncbi:MAG: flagellar biosynthesis protein FlhF [Phycisphaerae bacterium]|nr:flagellar biosynthesis protein FlhF [Phycisphaerae bacterium]
MSLKNYRAYTMAEAMAAVKRDLGADAIVVQTRTATQTSLLGTLCGGLFGIGRRTVVEVTAEAGAPESAKGPANVIAAPPSKRSLSAAAASRAYAAPTNAGGIATAAPTPSPAPSLAFDRNRTRLLAQAMAVKLDRESIEAPRTSAATAASANAAATALAAQRETQPAAQQPSTGVAQRYVLLPAAGHPRTAARAALLQTPTRTPQARSLETPAVTVPPSPVPQAIVAPSPTITDDLDAIERLVNDVIGRSPGVHASVPTAIDATTPAQLRAVYSALIAQDVADDLATKIIADLQKSLSPEELASEHAVRSAAIERVAALLPVCHGIEPVDGHWRRSGRPMTVAFVGPTGVGKTTTVAKIAATLKLRYGTRVGLITCDTYRIAAVDQLRTYAEIIGLPLEVALSPREVEQASERFSSLDVVLIDTAGRSQNDAARLGELGALVAAARPHETHLVLSSIASERVMLREAHAFAAIGIDRVVLTKLDEAAGLGAALRVLRQVGCSMSYITTGQEVPQHLECARPARLAELMLGGTPSP